MNISLVVAVTDNGVIGKNGKRGFYLYSDMRRFRLLTENKAVIMGRRTFESIPENKRPLPNRLNIVLSRDNNFSPSGAIPAANLDEALKIAEHEGQSEVFIIGGQEVFELAISAANRIYLTRVRINIEGDKFFNFDLSDWREVARQEYRAGGKDDYDFDFVELIRK